jgi:hypothetical protein
VINDIAERDALGNGKLMHELKELITTLGIRMED